MAEQSVETREARDTDAQLALIQQRAQKTQGQSFDDLIAGEVDVLLGRAVMDKDELIDVPFVITSITFRRPAAEARRDWVSLEVTTRDNREGVINDESTGIRRQILSYLFEKGQLPAKDVDATDGDALDAYRVVTHLSTEDVTFPPVRLVMPRGLRASNYTNEHGEGTTHYFA